MPEIQKRKSKHGSDCFEDNAPHREGRFILATVALYLTHLSQLEESATREGAPELHRGQKVCTTGAMF